MDKNFWQSRTLWFNALALLVLIAGEFGFAEHVLDPTMAAGVLAILNLLLRFWTKVPIKF